MIYILLVLILVIQLLMYYTFSKLVKSFSELRHVVDVFGSSPKIPKM